MQEKQNVASEPSRSFLKNNQEPNFPTRSILKNHLSFDLTAENVQRDCEANLCGLVSPERHVRFSGKDDILGPARKDFCFLEQNDGPLLSDAVAASSEAVKSVEENISIATDFSSLSSGTEVQPVFRREKLADDINNPRVEFPSSPSRPITVQPNTSRVFPEKNDIHPSQGSSYDNNNVHILESGSTGGSRIFFSPDASCGNAQGGNGSATPNFSEMFVNRGQACFYAVQEPVENRHRFPEPVSFIPATESGTHVLRFQSRPDEEIINDHAPCFRPNCLPHPMEWKENAVVLRRNGNENFFGLPLNSHGELIQSSSRGKCLYKDAREADIIGSSNGFLPANSHAQARTNVHFVEREFPSDHRGNCSLANNYARESRGFQLPARLGVTCWESNDRVDTHQHDFDRRINQKMNISFDGTRSYGQVHTQKMNEKIHPNENSGKISLSPGQPTVRLMGKDVPIGQSSKETKRSEDGNVWTDKEMIQEHFQSGNGLDNSSLTRNFQEWIPQMPSRNYKETVPAPLPPQTHFLVKAPGPSYYEWHQSNDAFQTNKITSPSFLPFAHLPTSATVFNGAPHLRDFFISESEPPQLGSQLSMLPPNPRDPFERVHWGPAVPQYFSKPGFEFPLVYQDSRPNLHVPSPWFQASNSGLPPWLLHAKQQGETPMISSQPHHISSRTNILNTPSVYRSAEGASYSGNLGPSSHQQGNAPFFITGSESNSDLVQTGYRNRTNVKERSRSRALGVKDLYPCKKINQGPVPKSAELLNPTRSILNLDELGGTVCYSNEARNNGMRSSGNESPRLMDGTGKSGPIKLSAGAKHILTPTQNVDLVENFIPIHSTIPFVVETSAGSAPHRSLKKATKIYRF